MNQKFNCSFGKEVTLLPYYKVQKTEEDERFKKLEVKKIQRRNGCDCWGRPEYDDIYIVLKDNKVIYESESDPTCLLNDLLNELTK